MSKDTYIPYETIYRWILTPSNHDMSDTEQTLFLYYITFEKECFKSLKSLMNDLKMSKNKIIAARKSLEQKGWILVSKSGDAGYQKVHVKVNQKKVAQLSKKHTVSKQPDPCSALEPPPVLKQENPCSKTGIPPVPKKATSEDYLSEYYSRENGTRESQPVQEGDLAPSLSFQQKLDNHPPHLRHEFINTEYSRLKQRKPLLIKALNSTASNPTAGNYKINVLKFEDKFPQATAESVIEWHSRGWLSTWQYKNEPRDKPEMGTITLAYVHPKSADERRAFESVETFLASESQESKPEKWVIDAYVKSGVKKSGLKKSQIKPAAQEVMKYATVTA